MAESEDSKDRSATSTPWSDKIEKAESLVFSLRVVMIIPATVALLLSLLWAVTTIDKGAAAITPFANCISSEMSVGSSSKENSPSETQQANEEKEEPPYRPCMEFITKSVDTVDAVLITAILLVIAFGIYTLFVSDINTSSLESARIKVRILDIKNIDELKTKLIKLIVLALIVKLFEITYKLFGEYKISEIGAKQLLPPLAFAMIITLIALTLFLTNADGHGQGEKDSHSGNDFRGSRGTRGPNPH